ncbi:permease [Geomonas subterranea]|nr:MULTISPECIES: permease [Geomonas]
MKEKLVDYRLFFMVLAANLGFLLWQPATARLAALNSTGFLLEVLSIVPPVMVLMGLLDVWVPRRLVEAHLGPDSGPVGAGVAMLLGTAAAGPLYAAFPVAVSLRKKGARLANIVIFLGTWGAIKIPMILMESSFISLRFALLRLSLTVPCILACGYLMERLLPEHELDGEPGAADA